MLDKQSLQISLSNANNVLMFKFWLNIIISIIIFVIIVQN